MARTLTTLRQEVRDRGFDYLTDARINQFINDAMHSVDEMFDWPYLQTTTSGTAPLAITDLRKIDTVLDTTNVRPLRRSSRGEIADWYGETTTVGTPEFYYVTNGTTVNTYPVSTSVQVQVAYWKFGPDLSAVTDEPLMPDRFRYAIVDVAVTAALIDAGNPQQASASAASGNDRISKMAESFGMLQPPYTHAPLVGDDC